MLTLSEFLIVIIPIVAGAIIAIVPTFIDRSSERKSRAKERQIQQKQEIYVEMISSLGKVLKGPESNSDIDYLREKINLVHITGSTEVVKALTEYLGTWGKGLGDEQNKRYCELIKAIRADLEVDKKENDDFPEIGYVDINIIPK